MNKKVLVAVSGGVDSSTTLLLLKNQGFEVAAVHLKLWDYDSTPNENNVKNGNHSLELIDELRRVCNSFSIPFYLMDISRQFKEIVISNFISEYKKGRTPNPCVVCNKNIKWQALTSKADEIGYKYIATGHYAGIEFDENYQRYIIRNGIDKTRNQSYFLWDLDQETLSKALMPLGKLKKTQIRDIAREFGLSALKRPESREICFIPDNNYRRFLHDWDEEQGGGFQSGEIVNNKGDVIGHHHGIAFYTIGQRKGMGISHPTPLYIKEIDPETNRIIVGEKDSLLKNGMMVSNVNWVGLDNPKERFNADIKIRYQHKPTAGVITPINTTEVEVVFSKAQPAVTPGQSAVFYRDNIILGGGIIESEKSS